MNSTGSKIIRARPITEGGGGKVSQHGIESNFGESLADLSKLSDNSICKFCKKP